MEQEKFCLIRQSLGNFECTAIKKKIAMEERRMHTGDDEGGVFPPLKKRESCRGYLEGVQLDRKRLVEPEGALPPLSPPPFGL